MPISLAYMGISKIFHSAPDMVSTLNPQSMHRKHLCTCIQAPQWFLPPPPPQGIASPPGPQVSPGTPKLECLHFNEGWVRVPIQMNFWKGSKKGGWGGSKAVWDFSKNSSAVVPWTKKCVLFSFHFRVPSVKVEGNGSILEFRITWCN